MAIHTKLARRQTSALLIRTFHWQRRQYCSLACNFIFPALLLVLLSFLSRIIRPPKFSAKPFELRPKGGYVARPFDVAACGRYILLFGDTDKVRDQCSRDPFVPQYIVPIYAAPSIVSDIGKHGATGLDNFGLLSAFSLDPFAYKPAFDPDSLFYETKTPYDNVFENYLIRSSNLYNIDFHPNLLRNMVLNDKFDLAYKSFTNSFNTKKELLQHLFDEWFEGGLFFPYSTALAFDSYSRNPDSISLTATVYFNGTVDPKCLYYCSHLSSIVRLYNALYQELAPGKYAFAYLRRMPRVDPFQDFGLIELIIGMLIGLLAHFLFPTFLRFLVLERVSRLRAMMASMGLRRVQYWAGTYISLLIIYMIATILIIIVGRAVNISFFSSNHPLSYIVLFFLCKFVRPHPQHHAHPLSFVYTESQTLTLFGTHSTFTFNRQ